MVVYENFKLHMDVQDDEAVLSFFLLSTSISTDIFPMIFNYVLDFLKSNAVYPN